MGATGCYHAPFTCPWINVGPHRTGWADAITCSSRAQKQSWKPEVIVRKGYCATGCGPSIYTRGFSSLASLPENYLGFAMLFKVSHPEYSYPFTCIVATDGCLYFKAADIARIAGYANPSQHAKRYATMTVGDVVFEEKFFSLPRSLFKTRIYDTFRIEELFGVKDFNKMFNNCVELTGDVGPTFNIRKAGTVRLVPWSDTTFMDFFKDFQERTLTYYERLIVREMLQCRVPGPYVDRYGWDDKQPLVIRRTSHELGAVKRVALYQRII